MESGLPIVEYFHSIQGEGAHVGTSAFFIRLASCKVGCPWCDTKESWSPTSYPLETVEKLSLQVLKAASQGAAFVVLTGGEPLHHNLNPLCNAIRKITSIQNSQVMPIHIETSGVDKITGQPNWITLSPKRHAPPRTEVLGRCHELKVVVHEKDDLIFAEEMAKQAIHLKENLFRSAIKSTKPLEKPLLFVQPGWGHTKAQDLALEYVKRNPQWRLSMQTHKWLGVL